MSSDGHPVFFYGEDGEYAKYGWDIAAAMKLVVGREPDQTDVARWVALLPTVCINEAHWPSANLSQPLIIVPMPDSEGYMVIDGWHRVRRALAEGITSLPAHILSPEEEDSVRRYGPGRP